jgi:hypothetical protein
LATIEVLLERLEKMTRHGGFVQGEGCSPQNWERSFVFKGEAIKGK